MWKRLLQDRHYSSSPRMNEELRIRREKETAIGISGRKGIRAWMLGQVRQFDKSILRKAGKHRISNARWSLHAGPGVVCGLDYVMLSMDLVLLAKWCYHSIDLRKYVFDRPLICCRIPMHMEERRKPGRSGFTKYNVNRNGLVWPATYVILHEKHKSSVSSDLSLVARIEAGYVSW